jgi:hypothetical protein
MASRAAHVFFWLCLAVTFVTLRFDNSDRLYFLGDDNLVAFLVEDINTSGHWQPDWYPGARRPENRRVFRAGKHPH